MSSPLICDGCSQTIRIGEETRPRLRLLRFDPTDDSARRDLFRTFTDGWDFCNVGCLATWATEREIAGAEK